LVGNALARMNIEGRLRGSNPGRKEHPRQVA
jgi:hypothetical protein